MADIELNWTAAGFGADARIVAGDLSRENELRTAVVVSLFSWRRANPDDTLPTEDEDPQGWWGDSYPVINGHKIGSRLWLLRREKLTQRVIARANEYCREALQWMIDDKVASAIDVVVERNGIDRLDISVTIYRNGGGTVELRFSDAWQNITNGARNG
jgi:phage gp46-like protein